MNNERDDGGQAFPVLDVYTDRNGEVCSTVINGMSLRDHFAGLAMQAAATNPAVAGGFTFNRRAEWAYEQADAMLKARQS